MRLRNLFYSWRAQMLIRNRNVEACKLQLILRNKDTKNCYQQSLELFSFTNVCKLQN